MGALRRPRSPQAPSTQPISPVNSIDLSPPDKRLAPPPSAPELSTEPPPR
jgi:hypothetical protein